ncbi:ATP-binding protein [Aetokthonos hydrillicola Thurmond2011]|uniref:histidine kinase n=2 Tax=Aetokthonos TaxID=1550243 RepID=A0AAP5IDD2_9CYAN|nr:ATP-binding protein [Aetokthonos hydrillicola Thurmond2011]
MFDREMRYLAASRRWLCDYNLQQENLIGCCHYEIFPESAEKWKAIHHRCLAGSTESGEADSFVQINGSVEWVKWESRPWYDYNGEIGGTVFFCEVITERKRTEEALRASEARFQKLAANVPGMIYQFVVHPNGSQSFSYVSAGCHELFELEPEEIQQNINSLFKLFHPEDLSEFKESILVSNKTLEPHNYQYRIITPSGRLKWVQAQSRPEKQFNGDLVWDGVMLDITARKQSEAQYRELALREQLLNRLASQIRNSLDLDTVVETAIKEIQQLLQIDCCSFCWYKPDMESPTWEAIKEAKNPNCRSVLGCYPASVVGPVTENLLRQEIVRVDNVATFNEPIHRQLLEYIGYQSEIALPIKTLSGEIGVIVCGHCSNPRPWTDSEVELLQAVVDQLAIAINQAELYAQTHQTAIAAKKQAQQLEQALEELKTTQSQLVQSEKMSSLGQLVAGVAHEINNPVNFIYGNLAHARGYTEDILNLLKLYQQAYPQPTEEIREEVDAIDLDFLVSDLPKLLSSMKVGADRIRLIVRSLRSFSRHDEAEMKAVDIHEGIDSTLMILQHRLKTKQDNPQIEVIKNYGNLPLVECYAGQLNQVFMNLLANAIDALEDCFSSNDLHKIKDNEKIAHPLIQISTEVLETDKIAIRIADNGPGIPLDVKKRLFDPFFTTKPIGVGTGLGLSISYQIIVEKHNGQLYCFSEVGQGTEFVIEIPACHSGNT